MVVSLVWFGLIFGFGCYGCGCFDFGLVFCLGVVYIGFLGLGWVLIWMISGIVVCVVVVWDFEILAWVGDLLFNSVV